MQMANKHIKRSLTLLIIREMQIKTTMGCHLTSVRITTIKKNTNNKCWRWCGEKETLVHCWWECKLMQPLWKTVWKLFKKLKIIKNRTLDDHCIYYCGQESLRRNGVALRVNKRVWNAVLVCISEMTEWSLFVSKANHSISQ